MAYIPMQQTGPTAAELYMQAQSAPGVSPVAAATAQQQRPAQAGGQNNMISPELVSQMLALQNNTTQQNQLGRQQKYIDALRAQGASPVTSTSPGGGRVGAPNYTQAIANVLAMRKARQQQDDKDLRQQNMDVEKNAALRNYFRSLTKSSDQNQLAPGSYFGEEGE